MLELISVHIPKTAGVSFHTVLKHVYGEVTSAYGYLDEPRIRPEFDSLLYKDYDARKALWDKAMAKVEPDVRVLADHAPVQLYDGLFPKARRVAWLRDPVQRVISNYIHIVHTDLHHAFRMRQGYDIYEYIHWKRDRNRMTFFTAGGDLERFFFVGIVEHFERDLAALAKSLKWPPSYPAVHSNVNKNPALKAKLLADPAVVAEIRKLNQQDIELYRRACQQIGKEHGHG